MKAFCPHCSQEYKPKKTLDAGTFSGKRIIVPLGIHGCALSKAMYEARTRRAKA